ncbi:MAG: DUF4908 domain-containing protein [Pseudomonadota bacterium]
MPRATTAAMALAVSAFMIVGLSLAQAQILMPFEQGSSAHYVTDDGSPGFVLDQTGSRAHLQFDGSNEVVVLDRNASRVGGASLLRDDGVPVIEIDPIGLMTVVTETGSTYATEDRTVEPLRLAARSVEAAAETAASVETRLSKTFGRAVSIEVDWASFDGDMARAAGEHQVYVAAEALQKLLDAGDTGAAAITTIKIIASDRINATPSGETLTLQIVPALGYGAGFSSALLADLLASS